MGGKIKNYILIAFLLQQKALVQKKRNIKKKQVL